MRRLILRSTIARKEPPPNQIAKRFNLKWATYSVAGRKSLGAKSFSSRRQVSHSRAVPGEEK
jgi:hypothetical protein